MQSAVEKRIGEYVDGHAAELVGFLQKVVQSKSLWGDVPELGKLGRLIHDRLRDGGVRAEYQDSGTPDAPNVLGHVGEATGRKLYLQLKSGDSYLRERQGDGAEIFRIKDERHSRYWLDQAFPVLLVIRRLDGEVRWMEVRDWLKRATENGTKTVKQIVFEGERFDVMSVRRWRDNVLGSAQ